MIEIRSEKDHFENSIDFHITVFEEVENPQAIVEVFRKKGNEIHNSYSYEIKKHNSFMNVIKLHDNRYIYIIQIKLITKDAFNKELLDSIATDLKSVRKEVEVQYTQYTTNKLKNR